ncbi:cytochrome C oxidase subunit IV family protein [Zhongshania guokunii]|uniref:Cytochrome C oxidase subunit IV family protein n=1 Tax=Zhongshania guokunii TaxID=641783 RepID=A0ABV3U2H7_9GAMM
MKSIFLQSNTAIWAVLAMATVVSWYLGGDAALNIPAVMLLIAFFKTRLVIMHFMELNHAPLALRIVGEAWGIVCCTALIVLYSMA